MEFDSFVHFLTLFTILASVAGWAFAAVGVPLADAHSAILTQVANAKVFLRRTTWTSNYIIINICVRNVRVRLWAASSSGIVKGDGAKH